MDIDPRFTLESGREILTGSQLLLKGALETPGGIGLLTGHPGAPVAGFFDGCGAAAPVLRDRGISLRHTSHETQAIAFVHGAQLAHSRAMAVFNHVGLHACAETLAAAAAAGVHGGGGAVIAVGDDTWGDAGPAADSRGFFEHLRVPLIEPSEPQEIKDWVDLAIRMSAASGSYIGLRLPAELAEGGGSVELRPNHTHTPRTAAAADAEVETSDLRAVPRQLAQARAEARRLGVNRIEHKPQKGEIVSKGFIAAGHAYAALAHALDEMGLAGRIPILKLGMTWPLDEDLLHEFIAQVSEMFVVEAGAAFVERQVHGVLAPLRQAGLIDTTVWGKTFPRGFAGIGTAGILHPSHLIERLVPLVKDHPTLPIELTNGRLTAELVRVQQTAATKLDLEPRTPTFCSGCPQRDTSGVLMELRRDLADPAYMQRVHRGSPIDLVVHGDSGCSSLMHLPPHGSGVRAHSGRGLGGLSATAVEPPANSRRIVFMGDDTFFHSGRPVLQQAIADAQDITYIIVPNHTAGFEGEQPPDPSAPADRGKQGSGKADLILHALREMTGGRRREGVRVIRMNPEDHEEFRGALEQAVLAAGVKIFVADKACAITAARQRRAVQGSHTKPEPSRRKQTFMRVVEDVCEHCLECTHRTGCPSLDIVDTDYGPKVQTNATSCTDDGACARTQVCPSFERVTVIRKRPPTEPEELLNAGDVPDPPRPRHAEQDAWRCALAGVGGAGVETLTRILASAGREMGHHVHFLTHRGAAIRTGPIFSQIVFARDPRRAASGHIPYGKADLLLALDPLEGARSIDGDGPYRVASPDATSAVVNTAVTPTVQSLLDGRRLDAAALRTAIQSRTRVGECFAADIAEVSHRLLGHGRYANVVMLGIAFQLGFVPVPVEALERSVRRELRHEAETNIRAFRLGRRIAADPHRFGCRAERTEESLPATLRRKREQIVDAFGRRFGRRYLKLVREARIAFRAAGVDRRIVRDYVVRAADCVVWRGGIEYAQRYTRRVLAVLALDSADRGHALTRAVIWNLAKVMLVKDEVYVAALLSSRQKRRDDRARFGVDPGRGDRIVYHRYHRPQLTIFGSRHTFEWRSRDWQLRLLARCRWIRALPGWGRRDRRLREWYERLVDKVEWDSDRQYHKWLTALSAPEGVTGFRDVRWPKIDAARAAAEAALSTVDEEPNPAQPRIRISLSDRVLTGSRV